MKSIHQNAEKGQAGEEPKGSLGIHAKLRNPPPTHNPAIARLERFYLQNIARGILPDERIRNCLVARQALASHVRVMKGKTSCFYAGLQTCGSVHTCPVCSSKIAEKRRLEVAAAIAAHEKRGGTVLLVTLTVPHLVHEPLKKVLAGLKGARRLHRNRKPYKGLVKRIGLEGTITATEVTYGENGWHPHPHELFFLSPGSEVDPLELKAELLFHWIDACLAVGLRRPNLHGVNVQDGNAAAKYVTKWGLDCEITKGHIKKGRESSLSMWDLLRQEKGDLFREFAKAMKGKKQLVWSKGLRALLGLEPGQTDEEVAAEVEEGSELLGRLSHSDWKLIRKAEARARILEAAEAGGWSAVEREIIEIIRELPCPF